MSPSVFGQANGQDVHIVEIASSDKSVTARIITHGAAIQDLQVASPTGPRSVVIGFDDIESYSANATSHHGAIAGRVANRIAHGKFKVDGKEFQVPTGGAEHVCHSGAGGFGVKIWTIDQVDAQSVTLLLKSADGDAGFPGDVEARVMYAANDNGVLSIKYTAQSSKKTPINLTNHAYFNLDGTRGGNTVTDRQKLKIHADTYTPVDAGLIPTGETPEVAGTEFDLRELREIAPARSDGKESFHFDHNFCLRDQSSSLHPAADMISTSGDLTMECWTDQPGLQFYDGKPLNVQQPGLGGFKIGSRAGICLETQMYPDFVNQTKFPQSWLAPGEDYTHHTEYRFKSTK